MDHLHQREKINNICKYAPEGINEQLANRLLNLIKSKTKIEFKKIYDKPRPLVMKLSKPELKRDIIKCRNKFIGKKFY